METKYIIRDLPVIKVNRNFNHLHVRNRCITKAGVQAIATGLNRIYDEHGDDFVCFDMEMLSLASGVPTETLRCNCKTPFGARVICEGVFIREMHSLFIIDRRKWDMNVNKLPTKEQLDNFLSSVAARCYDPTAQELIKLITRGVNPDVWYLAFEPGFDYFLPARERYADESKLRHNYKLAALIASDFALWVKSGFDMLHEEQFKQGIKDDITYINYAIQSKLKQLL